MVCYLLCTKYYLQLFFDLTRAQLAGAPNENIVQNYVNMAFLNVF